LARRRPRGVWGRPAAGFGIGWRLGLVAARSPTGTGSGVRLRAVTSVASVTGTSVYGRAAAFARGKSE
jgi:hypothetical protein